MEIRAWSTPLWVLHHRRQRHRHQQAVPNPSRHFFWLLCGVHVVAQTFAAPNTLAVGVWLLMRFACTLWDEQFTVPHVLVVDVETSYNATLVNATFACIRIAPAMACVLAVWRGIHRVSVRPKRETCTTRGFLLARGYGTMPCVCSCCGLCVLHVHNLGTLFRL